MTTPETEVIYTDDYTRIAQHDSKSWTIKDISLAPIGGASWIAARAAARRTALWFPVTVLPLMVLGQLFGWNLMLALLVVPIHLVVTYHRASSERQGGLSEPERRALRANFRRQPTALLGLSPNRDPVEFHWQLIFFQPNAPQDGRDR